LFWRENGGGMEELGEVVGGEEQDSGASLHPAMIRRMINYWH